MQNDDGYNVNIIDLPRGVHAFSRENEYGDYSIILNARDAFERQQTAYLHEVGHIARRDFENEDVQTIEFMAHRG